MRSLVLTLLAAALCLGRGSCRAEPRAAVQPARRSPPAAPAPAGPRAPRVPLGLPAARARSRSDGAPLESAEHDAPPPSAGHALVCDAEHARVLLVDAGLGGGDDAAHAGEPTRVWALAGDAWQLVDASGPPVRNLAGVAFDTRRGALVVHGGSSGTGAPYAETWEWRAGRWSLCSSDGPGARDHTAMAYDAARGRCVLFGGQVTLEEFPRDTWEWDGARWTRVDTEASGAAGPGPRVHHALAYDPSLERVVLYGGSSPRGPSLGDLWAFDGQRWSALGEGAPRSHAALAFDERLGALVAVGGFGPGRAAAALSAWREGRWIELDERGPSPRYLSAAAWDDARARLVVFGGGDAAGDALLADTWTRAAGGWTRLR